MRFWGKMGVNQRSIWSFCNTIYFTLLTGPAFAATFAVFNSLSGYLADNFNRKIIMLMGLLLNIAAILGILIKYAQSFIHLLLLFLSCHFDDTLFFFYIKAFLESFQYIYRLLLAVSVIASIYYSCTVLGCLQLYL